MASKHAWVLVLLISACMGCAVAASQGSVLDASRQAPSRGGQGQEGGARRSWAAPMQWLASVSSSFDVVAPSVFLSSNDQPGPDVGGPGGQAQGGTAGQEAAGGQQQQQVGILL
jgi:hypothetical protein